MDLEHTYQGIRFEWDSHKEEGNLKKHGISFKTACEAFLDPFVLPLEEKIVDDELRENIIGMTTDQRFLYVVFLWKDENILRIISARPATKQERMRYENQ